MSVVKLLLKSAALASSLTLFAGFVAFRAGAFDRPAVPVAPSAGDELLSKQSARALLRAEPGELKPDPRNPTPELQPVSLVEVPVDESLDVDIATMRIEAPVLPGSQETSPREPVASSKTVMAGSKGMIVNLAPPKPFYNSTAVQPNLVKTILNGSKSGQGLSIHDLPRLGTLISSLNLTDHDAPAIVREPVLVIGGSQRWFDYGSFTDTVSHFELSPDNSSIQEIRIETRAVISGSKSITATPMQDWSHVYEIFATRPWLFDSTLTTPTVLSPQPGEISKRATILPGSKSDVLIAPEAAR